MVLCVLPNYADQNQILCNQLKQSNMLQQDIQFIWLCQLHVWDHQNLISDQLLCVMSTHIITLARVQSDELVCLSTVTGTWSLPAQRGSDSGRMGHSSVYSAKTGLIYVVGGAVAKSGGAANTLATPLLLSYNPLNSTWQNLDTVPRYVLWCVV